MPAPERLTLKQVRTIDAVARMRGFAPAAQFLNSTQPVVSRTIASAEALLGRAVFQRGWGGTEPTAWGESVIRRCANALRLIDRAEADIAAMGDTRPSLASFVRWHHLDAVAAIVSYENTSLAAEALGVTQPAVSRAVAAITDYVHHPLFRRHRSGLAALPQARRLAALRDELAGALGTVEDLQAASNRGLVGRLAVGMLPFSGQDLVAKAFGDLTNRHPDLRLIAIPASYDMLVEALRHGEIDCIVGILRHPPKFPDLIETFLYQEEYTLVARRDHPCHAQHQTMSSLRDEKWLVGQHGTPIRTYFESLFESEGAVPPAQTCEIHSFSNAEQLVINSESIGLLTYSAGTLARMDPQLRKVDIELPRATVDIGLTTPRDSASADILAVFEETLRRFL